MSLRPELRSFFKQLTLEQISAFSAAYAAAENGQSLSQLTRSERARPLSTYLKTVTRLNDQARRVFGEPLLIKPPHKGTHWHPTESGKLFARLCLDIEASISTRTDQIEKLSLDRPLVIAMPQLPLLDLLKIEDAIVDKPSGKGFSKKLIHIRSESLPSVLNQRPEVDYAFGCLTESTQLDANLEFLRLRSSSFSLLANYDFEAVHNLKAADIKKLSQIGQVKAPLLMANQGNTLNSLLSGIEIGRNTSREVAAYWEIVRSRFNVIEMCNDVNFMIDLLCTSRERLCMFAMPEIVERAEALARSRLVESFWKTRKRNPPSIFEVKVSERLLPLKVGVIRRIPADPLEATHSVEHPFRIFWETCKDLAKVGSPSRGNAIEAT